MTRKPQKTGAGKRRFERPRSPEGAGCAAPPLCWREEVERVLITEEEIAQRVRSLSAELSRDFAGRELAVVAVLNGTVMFLADLIRHLSLPMRLDFIGISSYGLGTEPGEIVFTKDTGKTLSRVVARLRELKPRCIKICVLLEKAARRVEKVRADYVGFSIPDLFVVGYGLDFAERYRNLPFVGVLHRSVVNSPKSVI